MKRFILQRYVFWELGGPTILGLIVFTFVLLSSNLLQLMDLLINRGVPFPLFAALVGTFLPPLLILTIPMALLVGVLLGIGRLANDSEIMAMRTSGVNLVRVFVPVMLAGLLLTGGLMRANAQIVPILMRVNEVLIDQIKFIVASNIEAGRVFKPESGSYDMWLYFRDRNPITQTMEGITLKVISMDAQDPTKERDIIVTARTGRIRPSPFQGYLDVALTSGTMHYFDSLTSEVIHGQNKFRYTMIAFNRLTWRVELEREHMNVQEPQARTTPDIKNRLKDEHLDEEEQFELKAELYQRRSIPWACAAFVLLGVPLAIRVKPTGKGVAFAIAFGLIFFYYVMLKWGTSLTQSGSSLGAAIIFMPNILIAVMGVWLFYRILRQ